MTFWPFTISFIIACMILLAHVTVIV
jgi:hypothetical protein